MHWFQIGSRFWTLRDRNLHREGKNGIRASPAFSVKDKNCIFGTNQQSIVKFGYTILFLTWVYATEVSTLRLKGPGMSSTRYDELKHQDCKSSGLDECQLRAWDVTFLLHSFLRRTSQAFCELLSHCYSLLFIHRAVNVSAISRSVPLIVTLTPHQCLTDSWFMWYYVASTWSIFPFFFLADLCLHTHSQKLWNAITQSMSEILFLL